jgi:hypothetical protein
MKCEKKNTGFEPYRFKVLSKNILWILKQEFKFMTERLWTMDIWVLGDAMLKPQIIAASFIQ